jgi:hypothetical protein
VASAPPPDVLDLPAHVAQRSVSYRFELVNGRTGVRRGGLTPLRDTTPSLSHDSTSTISRRVSGVTLGVADAARIDPLVDRVTISMVLGDRSRTVYPLGRYMIADSVAVQTTGGTTAPLTLLDEMLLIDQDLESGFNAGGQLVDQAVLRLLEGLPIGEVVIDSTEQTSAASWSPGTSRASALNELATMGGYFRPWFDHHGRLRIPRAFEPAGRTPTIDLDATKRVLRNSISRTSELLTAPNRWVVVSNDPGSGTAPVVGTYDVAAAAPHSITRRGFVVPKVVEAQLPSQDQATVYARTLGIQQTIYEVVELSTPPDPRHDGYDVLRWDGLLWLEVGWTMPLAAGGEMRHTLRRTYPNADGDDTP